MDVSYSSLGLFRGCERKFELTKIYCGRRERLSHAGDVGNALHAALQEYARTKSVDFAIYTLFRKYPRQYAKSDFDQRGLPACYATLLALIQKFEEEAWELATVNSRPAIEVAFCIKIKGTDFRYVGKMDFIIRDKHTGKFFVVDLKTTTKEPLFRYSDQCIPYGFVLEQLQTGEATMDFTNRLLDIWYMVGYIDIFEPRVAIEKFTKTGDDLDEWAFSLMRDIKDIELVQKLNMFRRNDKNCRAYNRDCEFYSVCYERDPERLHKILEKDEPYTFDFDVTLELDIGMTT